MGVKRGKKAVSPVVATVLLILIVVILAVIVFLWARGFIGESLTKKCGNDVCNVDNVCDDISLEILYSSSDGTLQITNTGNTPVFSLEVQKKLDGEITHDTITQKIYIGSSIETSIDGGDYEWIKVYPQVLADGESGKVVYTCKTFIQPS